MMQLDMFPTAIRLQCIDPAKNKRRFLFSCRCSPHLFGEMGAGARVGRRIGRAGRVRRDAYPSAGPALDALSALKRQKGRRGYR